ncbi:GspH/FimT family pseudopilin [Variovorax sp. KK3]|uniref:GspH/FimT family pseudopilin n=1 Tax=Variovorax sp. KK3 TaxID=1855728 RepID=UPI0015C38039|nr:GspH/FimT family pseudopilin [Variovorax sp. KK3]
MKSQFNLIIGEISRLSSNSIRLSVGRKDKQKNCREFDPLNSPPISMPTFRLSKATRPTGHRHAGFTLIEAMVVLAISAILTALAAPTMRNLIESNSVSDSVESLMGSISLARAEAIKRGVTVTICASEAAKTGVVACGNSDAWSVGWLVFVDYSNDGSLAATDTVLRVQGSFEKNGSISNSKSYLSFKPTGTIGAVASGTFAFAPASASKPPNENEIVKVICSSSGGRVRVVAGTGCSS